MQNWPELNTKALMTVLIAVFRSASSKTMLAALPPSSMVNGLRVLARELRHVRADLGRAGEGDLVDAGMAQTR